MQPAAQSPIDARHAEMFPMLAPSEVGRISRLGERRTYPAGAHVFSTSEIAPGAFVLLSGQVDILQRVGDRDAELIVSHGPGSFMGELAQLSGRPALVDGVAKGPVEVLVIPQPRLRDLLVEEAELGERIMRALILRRVTFERFHIAPRELPIVLCPGGEILRNPSEVALARCIGLVATLEPDRIYDVAIVGAGPAGLAAAVYATSEGFSTRGDAQLRGGLGRRGTPRRCVCRIDGVGVEHQSNSLGSRGTAGAGPEPLGGRYGDRDR